MLDNQLIALIIQVLLAGESTAGISGTPITQAFQPTNQGVNTPPTAFIHKISDHRYGWRGATDVWNPTTSAAFTASISGSTLDITHVSSGTITVGSALSGINVLPGTIIVANGSGSGGIGTYTISNNQNVASEEMITAAASTVHTENQKYETTFQLSALATQNPATPNQYTASDICNLCASILQSTATIVALEAQGVGIYRITDVRNPYFMDDRQQYEASPSFDFTLTHNQIIVSTTPIISEAVFEIEDV